MPQSNFQGGVSGNGKVGCDAIVVSDNCPVLREADGFRRLAYSATGYQRGPALFRSYVEAKPVRVFRSSDLRNAYAPPQPNPDAKEKIQYRYDGLYLIEHVWDPSGGKDPAEFKSNPISPYLPHTFVLRRLKNNQFYSNNHSNHKDFLKHCLHAGTMQKHLMPLESYASSVLGRCPKELPALDPKKVLKLMKEKGKNVSYEGLQPSCASSVQAKKPQGTKKRVTKLKGGGAAHLLCANKTLPVKKKGCVNPIGNAHDGRCCHNWKVHRWLLPKAIAYHCLSSSNRTNKKEKFLNNLIKVVKTDNNNNNNNNAKYYKVAPKYMRDDATLSKHLIKCLTNIKKCPSFKEQQAKAQQV